VYSIPRDFDNIDVGDEDSVKLHPETLEDIFGLCEVEKSKPIAFRKLVRLHKLGAAYGHQTDYCHGRRSHERKKAAWHDGHS
jgi:hypothetical protein